MLSAGTVLQLLFQFVQIFRAADFACIGQAKYEVAKAELLGQIFGASLSIALASACAGTNSLRHARAGGTRCGWFAGRRARPAPGSYHAREFKTGLGTELALHGKFDVRYETEEIVAILLHQAAASSKFELSRILGRACMRTSLCATLMPS